MLGLVGCDVRAAFFIQSPPNSNEEGWTLNSDETSAVRVCLAVCVQITKRGEKRAEGVTVGPVSCMFQGAERNIERVG
jgi:hypothetical protein